MNASLITGLESPSDVAVSGGNLLVADSDVREYTFSGATVNASLITRSSGFLSSIAVSGTNLFVVNPANGTVGKYTTSGATVNASLITGLGDPFVIAVAGGNLFVASFANNRTGTIGEYTTSGVTVNASLITGLSETGSSVYGMAVSGGNLFVANSATGTIAEYTTSGAMVNPSFITGLGEVYAIYVSPPAVSSWIGISSKNWADSGNWSSAIPGATAGTTNTDTALFNQNAPNSPLTIDAGRNIQNITFDTASVNSLTIGTIGGQALLLTTGGVIQTTSTVVNPQTVNAPLVLEGNYAFTSGANSSSATLSFRGGITPGTTSGITTLTLNGTNAGANTISGLLADNGSGRLAITKNGSGLWLLSVHNTYSGGTAVLAGTLKFNVTSGSPTIAAGVTATVASGATLELAGSVSALGSAGGNRTHVLNNSTSLGLIVSGTSQIVGGIDGTGNVQVNAGSDLTADHIIQNALIIGGAAGNPGLVTIDAADAAGNPLAGGMSLAGSLASNGPFGAGIGSAGLFEGGASNSASSAGFEFTMGHLSAGTGSAAVPEPSALALAGCGFAIAALVGLRRRQRRLKTNHLPLTTVN